MPLIFEHLDDWRKLTGSATEGDASELHGLVCGLLAAAPGRSTQDLLRQLERLGEWDWNTEIREHLARGILESASALDSEDFSFSPLLPPDSSALDNRAACLGSWCGGFIAGFGAGQAGSLLRAGAEQDEVLRDLEQISRVEVANPEIDAADAALDDSVRDDAAFHDRAFGDGDSEDQEQAYAELVEYVRMAVMLMRQSSRNQLQANA